MNNYIMFGGMPKDVISYEVFEQHMIELEKWSKYIIIDFETNEYKSTILGIAPEQLIDIHNNMKMYFDLHNHIFHTEHELIEGFTLIELWCFIWDFGKKFKVGDIENTCFSLENSYFRYPDLTTYYKMYEFLCAVENAYNFFSPDILEQIEQHIYIHCGNGFMYNSTNGTEQKIIKLSDCKKRKIV